MRRLRYGLNNADFYKIINVFQQYPKEIEKVVLFGSRARGDYKVTSDIDLAIKFRSDEDCFHQIWADLNELNLINTIDLINYSEISNHKLKSYIDTDGKVIFLTNFQGEVVIHMNKLKDKLEDLEKALTKLKESASRDPKIDDIVIDATIQRFEFTYELSWKLMKAYLEYQGNLEATSPRRAIQEAFKIRLIEDGNQWLKMLESRNRTSHTYDEEIAWQIFNSIKEEYIPLFNDFVGGLNGLGD